MEPVLLWLRRDLRIGDNPALASAVKTGRPIIPVFIRPSPDDIGGASAWWRSRSLAALRASLRKLGSDLVLRTGDPLAILAGLGYFGLRAARTRGLTIEGALRKIGA